MAIFDLVIHLSYILKSQKEYAKQCGLKSCIASNFKTKSQTGILKTGTAHIIDWYRPIKNDTFITFKNGGSIKHEPWQRKLLRFLTWPFVWPNDICRRDMEFLEQRHNYEGHWWTTAVSGDQLWNDGGALVEERWKQHSGEGIKHERVSS